MTSSASSSGGPLLVRLAASLAFADLPPDAGPDAGDLDAGSAPPAPAWTPPKLAHFEAPQYPLEAQAKQVEGNVVLRLTVDSTGAVTEAQVLSSPDPSLAAAGQTAALKFRFQPATNAGSPEASVVRYTLQFRLDGETSQVMPPPPAPPVAIPTYQTHVITQAATSAASAESVYDQDLEQRIIRTPADLLHSVPGLFTAQHQGGGKADQYFLRGFDADHGTDIAFSMDGVPINLPSNGHGQGYTDVHFVLPETIDRLEFSKGPYFADKGDFDTAGAVELHTRHDFAENELQGAYGQFETYRVMGVATTGTGPNAGWVAGEVYGTNGPFENPEGLQRMSVTGKQNLQLTAHTQLSLEAVAYASQWSASGLIPPRAIADGQIDQWGSIDPNEGGSAQRELLVATLKTTSDKSQQLDITTYVVRYQMRLFDDFTFFLTDPVNEDLVEQNDDRVYAGLDARYRKEVRWRDATFTTTLGGGGRYDSMNVSLYHDDSQRQHLPSCYGEPLFCDNADIGQSNLFLWAEENARLTPWLRVVAGARGDLFNWNVADQRAQPLPGAAPTTGIAEKSIANPKLAIVLTPLANWDLYLDGGGGFHSNDARSIIAVNGSGALPRAWGAELGSRVTLWSHLQLSAALWFLYLEDEVAFDPDVDTTVSNPPSRRYGLDFSGRWDIYRHWLWADVDLMVAHVQYTQEVSGGYDIPLAPTETCTAGLSMLLPFGLRARVAMRQIDDRAATTDGTLTAVGYTLFDFTAAYRWRFLELGVSVENALNSAWREGQFAYASRLAGEPAAGVTEVDFTPGNPINLQGNITLFF